MTGCGCQCRMSVTLSQYTKVFRHHSFLHEVVLSAVPPIPNAPLLFNPWHAMRILCTHCPIKKVQWVLGSRSKTEYAADLALCCHCVWASMRPDQPSPLFPSPSFIFPLTIPSSPFPLLYWLLHVQQELPKFRSVCGCPRLMEVDWWTFVEGICWQCKRMF